MKKLLVFVAAIAVASLANAEIFSPMLIVDLGGTYGIVLPSGMSSASDTSGGYWALIGAAPTSGVLAVPATLDLSSIGGDAGDTGLFPAGSGVYGWFVSSRTSAWTTAAGVYANGFTLKTGAWSLRLYRIDDAATVATLVDDGSGPDIPEPATIALLSLGGLLLRRKK